jgi:hypothetical protein
LLGRKKAIQAHEDSKVVSIVAKKAGVVKRGAWSVERKSLETCKPNAGRTEAAS